MPNENGNKDLIQWAFRGLVTMLLGIAGYFVVTTIADFKTGSREIWQAVTKTN